MHERTVTITTSTLLKSILVLAAVWVLFVLRDIVIVMLTAILIASALEPATKWLEKRKMPRTMSVLAVYASFLGILFGVLYLFVPIFLSESANFVASVPKYLEAVRYVPPEYAPILDAANTSPDTIISGVITDLQSLVGEFSRDSLRAVSTIFGGVVSFVLILVFSFYFSIQEHGIADFLRVVTPVAYEEYVIGLWRRAQKKIGLWMQGQLLLGVIISVLVYLLLTIIGIEHALVLAVVAGVFELIPVFGPVLSAVPAVMVGFGDGGITMGLLVIAIYLIIQQFENHLIYPLVVTKVVGVPPLLVILGIVIGAKLAGVLGILLSAPIAAVLQELITDADKERRRGRLNASRT